MTHSTREDALAFVNRDWESVGRLKEERWVERQRAMSNVELLRLSESLWLQARAARPEGPSEEERREDLETHLRVGHLLRSIPRQHPGET